MDNSWAAPGVRCVCVTDEFEHDEVSNGVHRIPTRWPVRDEVLTIRTAGLPSPGSLCGNPGAVYLTFWEIEEWQQDGPLGATIGWNARHFRPLVEQQTDISLFTSMLDTAHEPANV